MVEQTFLPVTLVYWGHIFVLFFFIFVWNVLPSKVTYQGILAFVRDNCSIRFSVIIKILFTSWSYASIYGTRQ